MDRAGWVTQPFLWAGMAVFAVSLALPVVSDLFGLLAWGGAIVAAVWVLCLWYDLFWHHPEQLQLLEVVRMAAVFIPLALVNLSMPAYFRLRHGSLSWRRSHAIALLCVPVLVFFFFGYERLFIGFYVWWFAMCLLSLDLLA